MIGRNDPCPCGRGIKYKKCCSGMQNADEKPTGPGADAVMDELKEMLQGQSINSLEEANAIAAQYLQKRNQSPIDDFHGLTSEQVHRFLYFPFETPQLAEFPSRLDITPEAPVVTLFTLLAEAIGEQGMKPTATGNLPRNFCRESALAYFGKEEYQSRTRLGDIQREPEFGEMHVTRLVAELAGLIRKYKGKFILSKECRTILAKRAHRASTRGCSGLCQGVQLGLSGSLRRYPLHPAVISLQPLSFKPVRQRATCRGSKCCGAVIRSAAWNAFFHSWGLLRRTVPARIATPTGSG